MMEETAIPRPLPAILLAGGRALRLGGGDKCLRLLAGRSILARVIEVMRPQTDALVLNANGPGARFAAFGLPVVGDDLADHPGPLAGILTGLDWVAHNVPAARFALSVSTDCPFLPTDLVRRLAMELAPQRTGSGRTGADEVDIVVAASQGRIHPVIGLWRVGLRHDLRRALVDESIRKVERFCERHRTAQAHFSAAPIDPFFNVNTATDLAQAEALLARIPPPFPGTDHDFPSNQ